LDTHQSCVIWKIEYVKSREAAAALVAARKKAEAEGGK